MTILDSILFGFLFIVICLAGAGALMWFTYLMKDHPYYFGVSLAILFWGFISTTAYYGGFEK